MADVDELKGQIQILLTLMQSEADRADNLKDTKFKVDLMWKAFIGGVGLILLTVIGALIALVIGG